MRALALLAALALGCGLDNAGEAPSVVATEAGSFEAGQPESTPEAGLAPLMLGAAPEAQAAPPVPQQAPSADAAVPDEPPFQDAQAEGAPPTEAAPVDASPAPAAEACVPYCTIACDTMTSTLSDGCGRHCSGGYTLCAAIGQVTTGCLYQGQDFFTYFATPYGCM